MATSSSIALSTVFALSLIGTVQAADDAFKQINLGFGNDQGDLSITGSLGRFNGFASNEGMALDYLVIKHRIKKDWPVSVYAGGGAYISRHNDIALRVPLGLEVGLGKSWNIYGQLIPNWQVSSPQGPDFVAGYGLRFQF